MAEPRSVVITGAARGLGLASATRLYRDGWRVVAAMRNVDAGMTRLRAATGAGAEDPRLIGVHLDLTDPASVAAAAEAIEATVGAPYALVHNAGISAAGMVEETPISLWEKMFHTTVFGPVALTAALLPAMRAAGRGRIVLVSSQGGVRGMPATAAYSSAKGALERWGESLAAEVAPFGIGVTVLITGTYDTSPDRMPATTPPWTNGGAWPCGRPGRPNASPTDWQRRWPTMPPTPGARSGPMRGC